MLFHWLPILGGGEAYLYIQRYIYRRLRNDRPELDYLAPLEELNRLGEFLHCFMLTVYN